GGDRGQAHEDGDGDPAAHARRERPEPRIEVHAGSLEPIRELWKREMRRPGDRDAPPEDEPTPAVGFGTLAEPRVQERVECRAGLRLAEPLAGEKLQHVLVVGHCVFLRSSRASAGGAPAPRRPAALTAWHQSTTAGSPAAVSNLGSPRSGFEARATGRSC